MSSWWMGYIDSGTKCSASKAGRGYSIIASSFFVKFECPNVMRSMKGVCVGVG